MVDSFWADFWWSRITGANLVVTKVVNALRDNKMVVLDVPDDLPWRYQMRSSIELGFRDISSESSIVHIIDAADECGNENPGMFLLEKFCMSRDVRTGYRSNSKLSIQEYLINNGVLRNSIIWVKGLNKRQISDWYQFCKNYYSSSIDNGLFVLEVRGFNESVDTNSARLIRFEEMVSSYDVQLFVSFMLDSKRSFKKEKIEYIASVISSLCGSDAEVAAELLDSFSSLSVDPVDALTTISQNQDFSARGAAPGSNHILSCCRTHNMAEINKRIWTAQVRTLFPIIEIERRNAVELFSKDLEQILRNKAIKQYGEPIVKLDDIEIGTLDYIVGQGWLRLQSKADKNRISFLHDCRNMIAHMDVLSPDDVSNLLAGHFSA